jgi:predicted Fe-S protein YdhL (DUF1289 family)
MDDISGVCLGCYRTSDEIAGWWDLKPEAQKVIIAAAKQREADAF